MKTLFCGGIKETLHRQKIKKAIRKQHKNKSCWSKDLQVQIDEVQKLGNAILQQIKENQLKRTK
jgi:hypothetical protein